MKNWKAISIDNKKICSFKTKKEVIHCLKESYLKDHVPFFELDSQGRLDGFTFKEFLTDFKITRV